MCDRYRLGLASDSPRQVWSVFQADATGQQCDEFREISEMEEVFIDMEEAGKSILDPSYWPMDAVSRFSEDLIKSYGLPADQDAQVGAEDNPE
jgi:hypothetical protein